MEKLGDGIYSSKPGDQQPEPVFDPQHSADVTAILGKTALLNCRVSGVANRTVSWIRHKDTHLLTAGRYTYTSDMRFRAIHKVMSEDYLLQILPVEVEYCVLSDVTDDCVQAEDGGVYECQVSTTPVTGHQVTLRVAGKITMILSRVYLSIIPV